MSLLRSGCIAKECPTCQQLFTPKKTQQQCCSKRCAVRRRPPRPYCKHGHEFTEENTLIIRGSARQCRACMTIRRRNAPSTAARHDPVKTLCPQCGEYRIIARSTSNRLKHMPRLCRFCSRQTTKQRIPFLPQSCAKCKLIFAGRSGAARFCDLCAGRIPKPAKSCPVCNQPFYGYKSKKTCSQSCRRRILVNEQYFGGRMFEAIGWQEKVCQLCNRSVDKNIHVHHVFGHPRHDSLVVLCAGCHDTVSTLAQRPTYQKEQFRRLQWYVMAQRLGSDPGVDAVVTRD